MASLTKGFVENAIDDACHYIGEKVQTLRTNGGLTVRRIRDQDWHIGSEEMVGKDVDASDYLKSRTPWHFGISVRNAHNNSIIGRVTFYVAYSSWSGRIIYIDRMDCKGLNDETEELLLRILADVALALDCVRLTWRVSFSCCVLPGQMHSLRTQILLRSTPQHRSGIPQGQISQRCTVRY